MTDYRELSEWKQKKVDEAIINEIEPKHHINEYNGYEWDEPQGTLDDVHNGQACAICWNVYYNCLCSHDS